MAQSILVLDEKYRLCRSFVQALCDRSYQVKTDYTDLTRICEQIDDGRISGVVFGAVHTKECWDFLEQIVQRYQWLPVIYVLVNDHRLEQKVPHNPCHRVVRPLTSRQRFVELLERLIHFSHSLRAVAEQPSAATPLPLFEALDANLMIDRVLSFFGEKLECSNVHWVRAADFEHIQGTPDGALQLELETQFRRTPRLRSLRDADVVALFKLLRQLSKSRRGVARHPRSSSLRIEVFSPQGELLGHLVFEELLEGLADFPVEQIQETLKVMAQPLAWGLEHWAALRMSHLDDLTDLYNQRYLPEVLEREISRAQRQSKTFCVLFLDIDYFKLVNDTRGHWVGSKVLVELGNLLKGSVRSCDYAFRYGGDEFVLILVDTNAENGEKVAERIRKTVEAQKFVIDGCELQLTVSIGMAAFPDHAQSKEQVLKMADQAMYCGKNKSRNIVYVAS